MYQTIKYLKLDTINNFNYCNHIIGPNIKPVQFDIIIVCYI